MDRRIVHSADPIVALTAAQREEAQVVMLRIFNARHSFGRPERRSAWLSRMPPVRRLEPARPRWPQSWRRTDLHLVIR